MSGHERIIGQDESNRMLHMTMTSNCLCENKISQADLPDFPQGALWLVESKSKSKSKV